MRYFKDLCRFFMMMSLIGVVAIGGPGSLTAVAVSESVSTMAPSAVSAGNENTCALFATGAVSCWGFNNSGGIGNGTYADSNLPIVVKGGALDGKQVSQIGTGAHSCALITDGSVACWGQNSSGQLGTGNNTRSNLPVMVDGGALTGQSVTQIAVGFAHTCALIADGSVACWGENGDGQLGTGNSIDTNLPVLVDGGALSSQVVTQIATGDGHTCALIAGGTVSCWGQNFAGELGNGNTEKSETPVLVDGGALSGEVVTEIATGYSFTCALIAGGTVSCWGENNSGQLGTGDENDSNVPVLVDGGSFAGARVIQLATGTAHTCALLSRGTVSCWGRNRYGQLGIGNNTNESRPTPSDWGALNQRTVTQITLGSYHTCALISDGTLVCWGFNSSGQLGRGNNRNTNAAAAVVWPTRATAVEKPTISGSATVGQQLVANKGEWTGTPVPSFTYQWYSCTSKIVSATRTVPSTCQAVPNSNRPKLTLAEAQSGKFIAIAVTGKSKATAATRWLSKSTIAVS